MRTRHVDTKAPAGFTLIELLIVVAVIGLLAAIAAPFMVQAKAIANEASAISTMRAMNSAQATYLSACGSGRYASTMSQLVSGEYASRDMDLSPKSGFHFGVEQRGEAGANGCDGEATQTGYYGWAEPMARTTGTRAFATDHGSVIWQDTSGERPADPFTAGGTIAPLGK